MPSLHHLLCRLALLQIQSQARGNNHRDIEDLLAERGIIVSREAIRLWCIKFGAIYTRRLKRKYRGYGDTFYVDEVFTGVPDHSNQRQAALSLARGEPRKIVTDKLRSYGVAYRELIPESIHSTKQ